MKNTCNNCNMMEKTFNKTIALLKQQRENALDSLIQERLIIEHLKDKELNRHKQNINPEY